jgi:hypothetical protein
VRALLGLSTSDRDDQADTDPDGTPPTRYAWELAKPDDPDLPPLGHRLLRAISERIQQRAQLEHARRLANAPPLRDSSATALDEPAGKEEVRWMTSC